VWPALSAELMSAMVRRAGHTIRVVRTDAEVCTLVGIRADDPGQTNELTYTVEEAKAAGLMSSDTWKKHTAAMLRARATSALCRLVFPDVLMGASYTPEELGAQVDPESGEVIDIDPADYRTVSPHRGRLEQILADADEVSPRTRAYLDAELPDLGTLDDAAQRQWVDWAAGIVRKAADAKAKASAAPAGDEPVDAEVVEEPAAAPEEDMRVGKVADRRTKAHNRLHAVLTKAKINPDDDLRHWFIHTVTRGATESTIDLINDDATTTVGYDVALEVAQRIVDKQLGIGVGADGQRVIRDTDGNDLDLDALHDQIAGGRS
jgi:hypothetical protein